MSYLIRFIGLALLAFIQGSDGRGYYGKLIGRLSELQHLVKGDVYAVDSRTIHIKGFTYDGTAPDAFFYVGKSGKEPHDKGIIIPDEKGSKEPLGAYSNKDVTITLPDGLTLKDAAWFSIWCRAYTINFGHLMIPRHFEYPRPQKIGALPTYEHEVSSDKIVVVDAQTFLIPNFKYDGQGPDAFFWVGRGSKPGPEGTQVPDENGSLDTLKRYTGKTIVITLPGDLTVFDIDYLSVWCRAFFVDFGHVLIPSNLNVPPSLKMLGVAPQTKLNCEVLHDDLAFEVRWAVAGDSIVMQLVGKVENGEYMAFGLSGNDRRSVMVGGDVTVAWLDQVTGRGEAIDYILDAKSQCQGSRGSCPDTKIPGSSNNVRLLNAAFINSFTMLTFQRPLSKGRDPSDITIDTNRPQAVIWAIGPVNSQGDTSYHRLRLQGDLAIDFGRSPTWNCPLPDEQDSKPSRGGQSQVTPSREIARAPTPRPAPRAEVPWHIPAIPCYEPEDGVFYAQIGPTGGDRGYNAITGHVGWGISWYINGLLIPEINVVRGKTYTFVIEGGNNPESPAKFHPFYITDDPEGGYEFKTDAEKSSVRVFAGVDVGRDGVAFPSASGRLCEWKQNPNQPAEGFDSFGAYQRSLTLDCLEGQPGILQWTPDRDTPNTVYYQCFTHRFLGWKINVMDPNQCDGGPIPQQTIPSRDISRTDYDYYFYDDDSDTSKTRLNTAVTLGGTTRYEKGPTRETITTVDSANSVNDYPDKSLEFDSFPFNFDKVSPYPDLGIDLQASPKPPFIKHIPPLELPEFTFPSLPPLSVGSPAVNATGFSNFGLSHVPRVEKATRRPVLRTKPTIKRIKLSSKKNPQQEIESHQPTEKERDSRRPPFPFRNRPAHSNKERIDRETLNQNKLSRPRTTQNPIDLLDRTREANLLVKFKMDDDSSVFPQIPTNTSNHINRLNYQTIPGRTTPSYPKYSPSPSITNTWYNSLNQKPTFEVRKNPTKRPVVIAKPFNHTLAPNTVGRPVSLNRKKTTKHIQRLNHGVSKFPETNQVSSYGYFNSNKRYNHQIIDPETGMPYATNNGFDPSTVIFENDFKPVNQDGSKVISPLAFQVSSTQPVVGVQIPTHGINQIHRPTPERSDSFNEVQESSESLQQLNYVPYPGQLVYRDVQHEGAQHHSQNGNLQNNNIHFYPHNIDRSDVQQIIKHALPAFKLRPPPPPPGSSLKRFARKMSESVDEEVEPETKSEKDDKQHSRTGRSRDFITISSDTVGPLTFFPKVPTQLSSSRISPRRGPLLTSISVFDHPSRRRYSSKEEIKNRSQNSYETRKKNIPQMFLPPPLIYDRKSPIRKSRPTMSLTDEKDNDRFKPIKNNDDFQRNGTKNQRRPVDNDNHQLKQIKTHHNFRPIENKKQPPPVVKDNNPFKPIKNNHHFRPIENKNQHRPVEPTFDFTKSQERLIKSVTKSTHLTILKDIWDNLTGGKLRKRS